MSRELERRVETVESELQALRAQLTELSGRQRTSKPAVTVPASSGAFGQSEHPTEVRSENVELNLESLITKIGVVLVLLGIAFLLKYSYDQGWLTESMRVVMGLLGGTALLGTGLHQRDDNPNFAAILMGGALAAFYGSIFAAHGLYDLVGWTVALPAMIGTTMLGFGLALRQKRAVLSCIATIGGFATPFVLDGADSASMLEAYTLVLLAGTSAVYLLHGWRSLLGAMTAGSLAVLIPCALEAGDGGSAEFAVTAAVIYAMVIATSIVPAVRASFEKVGELGWFERCIAVAIPMLSIGLFQLATDGNAVIVGISTVLLAAIALGFHSLAAARTKTYLVTGSALGVSAALVFAGIAPLAAALASIGVCAHVLSREQDSGWLRTIGYSAMVPLGLWTAFLLVTSPTGAAFFNPVGLQMLVATATLVAVAWTFDHGSVRWGHYGVATFAALAVLAHQLSAFGDEFATGAWGLVALGLLVAGFVREQRGTQILGVVVIMMTAAKLLVFDLETVEAIWRVALFITFGAGMLAISYWRGLAGVEADA